MEIEIENIERKMEIISEKRIQFRAKLISTCPSMDLIAIVSEKNQIHIFRLNLSKIMTIDSNNFESSVTAISWSSNGKLICIGTNSGFVHFYNYEIEEITKSFKCHDSCVKSLFWDTISPIINEEVNSLKRFIPNIKDLYSTRWNNHRTKFKPKKELQIDSLTYLISIDTDGHLVLYPNGLFPLFHHKFENNISSISSNFSSQNNDVKKQEQFNNLLNENLYFSENVTNKNVQLSLKNLFSLKGGMYSFLKHFSKIKRLNSICQYSLTNCNNLFNEFKSSFLSSFDLLLENKISRNEKISSQNLQSVYSQLVIILSQGFHENENFKKTLLQSFLPGQVSKMKKSLNALLSDILTLLYDYCQHSNKLLSLHTEALLDVIHYSKNQNENDNGNGNGNEFFYKANLMNTFEENDFEEDFDFENNEMGVLQEECQEPIETTVGKISIKSLKFLLKAIRKSNVQIEKYIKEISKIRKSFFLFCDWIKSCSEILIIENKIQNKNENDGDENEEDEENLKIPNKETVLLKDSKELCHFFSQMILHEQKSTNVSNSQKCLKKINDIKNLIEQIELDLSKFVQEKIQRKDLLNLCVNGQDDNQNNFSKKSNKISFIEKKIGENGSKKYLYTLQLLQQKESQQILIIKNLLNFQKNGNGNGNEKDEDKDEDEDENENEIAIININQSFLCKEFQFYQKNNLLLLYHNKDQSEKKCYITLTPLEDFQFHPIENEYLKENTVNNINKIPVSELKIEKIIEIENFKNNFIFTKSDSRKTATLLIKDINKLMVIDLEGDDEEESDEDSEYDSEEDSEEDDEEDDDDDDDDDDEEEEDDDDDDDDQSESESN
ncbi:anaphase promoting complex subunit 4 apc4 [Anaeramoeba flamelloides]|uniref:Anaphase promoting complex subunit 4 apc4 n=1 Tax=Anaeramoeba flamelloides TaxID=1746091 RepID=A0AAV7YET8_9EUKA|nr:anaphase promoting complex subunit 4 apc4 [Anaeramoeba flamelloides]